MLRQCYDLILTQSIQISEDFVGERIFLLKFHFVYSTGLAGFWVYEQLNVLFEYLDLIVIELVPGHNNHNHSYGLGILGKFCRSHLISIYPQLHCKMPVKNKTKTKSKSP